MVFNFANIHSPSEVSQLPPLQPTASRVTKTPQISLKHRDPALFSRCLQLMVLGPDPRRYLSVYLGPLSESMKRSPRCCFFDKTPSEPLENRVWTWIVVRDVANQGVERKLPLDIEGTCAALSSTELKFSRECLIDHLVAKKDFFPWIYLEVASRAGLRPTVETLYRSQLVHQLSRYCPYAFSRHDPDDILSIAWGFLPYLAEMQRVARKAKLAVLPPLDALSASFAQTTLLQIERGIFLEAAENELCIHVQVGNPPNRGAFKAAFVAISLMTGKAFASILCPSLHLASLEVTYLALAKLPNGEQILGIPKVYAIAAYIERVVEEIQEVRYEACIRMDYLPLSLKELIYRQELSLKEKNQITRALVRILSSLPSDLIHRDLKSANIAFPPDATLKKPLVEEPHLIDFAGAFYHPPPQPLILAPKAVQDEIIPNPLQRYLGSHAYSAPEKMRKYYPKYNPQAIPVYAQSSSFSEPNDHTTRQPLINLEKQADLYSLGRTLQEMYLEKDPSKTPFPDVSCVSPDWSLPFWEEAGLADTPIYRIAARLLHPEPSERRLPTDEELDRLESMVRNDTLLEILPGTVSTPNI